MHGLRPGDYQRRMGKPRDVQGQVQRVCAPRRARGFGLSGRSPAGSHQLCAKGAQPLVYSHRTNTYWNVQPGKVVSNIECLWDEANNSKTKYVNIWAKNKYGYESIPVRLDVAVNGYAFNTETPDARVHMEYMHRADLPKSPQPRIPHAMTHQHLLYGCHAAERDAEGGFLC